MRAKGFRKTSAVNRRSVQFKYYRIDNTHSLAVIAGRCIKCSSITDRHCSKCFSYVCENHVSIMGEDYFCKDCAPALSRTLTKKEKRKWKDSRILL